MDYSSGYNKFFSKLKRSKKSEDELFSNAVGGDYMEMGYLQMQILKMTGAESPHHIVNVGCGSGRLAHQLVEDGFSNYTGYDVVSQLLEYAENKCHHKGFQFHQISETTIPLAENSVDFVCFFSVFTHLLHEDSFKYLLSSKKILKPGGKVIFSFLTIDEEDHWKLFDLMVQSDDQIQHNQFVSNSQLEVWAAKLGFTIEMIKTGSTPFIPLTKSVKLSNGAEFNELGSLGQGVCIFQKPSSE